MSFRTAASVLTVAAFAMNAVPASAGGWGHGPSLHQAGRFLHDTAHQVVVPVVLGTLNVLGGGAARSARKGGGEYMDGGPEPAVGAPPAHEDERHADAATRTDPHSDSDLSKDDSPLVPWKDPWLENLKRMREMPMEPAGPSIGAAREPLLPPSCGMNCPTIIDHPMNDLPDPREEKSAEPPVTMPEILD